MVLEKLPFVEREVVEPTRVVDDANEFPRTRALVAPAVGRETDADFLGSGIFAGLERVAETMVSMPFRHNLRAVVRT